MHKGLENNLMDYLYPCIKRKKYHDRHGDQNQLEEKIDPPKKLVVPKELLLPKLFSRRHSSTFSTKRVLSVIKNYWKR
jgi:hypothetical protein